MVLTGVSKLSDSSDLYVKMKEKYTKTNICSLSVNLKQLRISKFKNINILFISTGCQLGINKLLYLK